MAWNSDILAQYIKDKVNTLTDEERTQPLPMHTAWAEAIIEFITDHVRILGVYSGTVSGGGSDPLNGPYKWIMFDITSLTGAILFAGAQVSFYSWLNTLIAGIRTTQFLGLDELEKITTSVPVFLATYSCTIDQEDMYAFVRDEAIDFVCEKIVDGLQSVTAPVPAVSAATSTSPGSGSVTFTILEQY